MTPEQRASMAAIARYQHSLRKPPCTRQQDSPRDLEALSVQIMHADDSDGRIRPMRRAASCCGKPPRPPRNDPGRAMDLGGRAGRVERLHRCPTLQEPGQRSGPTAEPDNAAAWVPAVIDALRFHNQAGIDDALGHMAVATRYDEVFHDAMGAWMDAVPAFSDSGRYLAWAGWQSGGSDAGRSDGRRFPRSRPRSRRPIEELIQACQRKPACAGRLELDPPIAPRRAGSCVRPVDDHRRPIGGRRSGAFLRSRRMRGIPRAHPHAAMADGTAHAAGPGRRRKSGQDARAGGTARHVERQPRLRRCRRNCGTPTYR